MRKYILHRVYGRQADSRCAMALCETDPHDGFLIEISVIVPSECRKISAVAIMRTLNVSSRASISKQRGYLL